MKTYMLSGRHLLDLVGASMCSPGQMTRVIWHGVRKTLKGHDTNLFGLEVFEGEISTEEAH